MNKTLFPPANFETAHPLDSKTATLQSLNLIAKGAYGGRILLDTTFSLEEQVLAHLIFHNDLPVRIYTRTGAAHFSVLARSVEYFNRPIEVFTYQAEQAALEFSKNHPAQADIYNRALQIAPLAHILQLPHVSLSGLRASAHQVEHPVDHRFNEQTKVGKTIFYPLYDWTDEALMDYIRQYRLPTDILPKDAVHTLHNRLKPTPLPMAGQNRNWWLKRSVRQSERASAGRN